jgi:RNA polymerase primary sigma factor
MESDPSNIQSELLEIFDTSSEEEMHEQAQAKLKREGTLRSLREPYASLAIYMNALNKYPPLQEDEELELAKQIKKQEKELKNLVSACTGLFKKEYLTKLSAKQKRALRQNFQSLNDTLRLFESLIQWDRKKKKIFNELNRLTKESETRKNLQDELHVVKAGIAKTIAEITLGETITQVMRDLGKLSYTKRQKITERELGRILRKIDSGAQEIKALKTHMIQHHLRLVFFLAKKYIHRGLPLADLIQEGNLGLVRAIDTYDYQRGPRFITYATWWIRQAFIRALNNKSKMIRKPVYINEQLNQINKASEQLLKESSREPTTKEIALKTGISLEFIERVKQSFKDPISLDTPYEGDGESIITFIRDKKQIPVVEQAIFSNLSETLDEALCDLTSREQEIVKLRFGIDATHDHTLEEIGEKFNLTRERIRQILEKALKKMRNHRYIRRLQDFIELN